MEARSDPREAITNFVERASKALADTDYYQVLGVSTTASESDIRAAYYQLASRLHPDLHNTWMDDAMQRRLTAVYSRVVEAYGVLTDGQRRERYNKQLSSGQKRFDVDTKVIIKRVEDDVSNPGARKFFLLGRSALNSGDGKAAVMNLTMALSLERTSKVIKAALAQAQELVDKQGDG